MKTKKILSVLILVSMIIQVSNVSVINGAETTDADYEYYSYAQKLAEIGVFVGTGDGFELDREPTRIEAFVILIRLLGKEEEALTMTAETSPFTDVPEWAVGYVNYGYSEGLTKGVSETKFGSSETILSRSFTTFILRSLGYDDATGDFAWVDANDFGKQIGLVEDELFDEIVNEEFLRNQVAKLSYNALVTDMKVMNKSDLKTLGEHLVSLGNIDETRAKSIEIVREEVVEEVIEEVIEEIAEEVEEEVEEIVTTVTPLVGPATATKAELATWARDKGMSEVGIDLIDIYYEICEEKGLNPVIQYVQMCLETGWLYKVKSQAGIDVTYHNPCGLKTTIGGDEYIASEFTKFDSWYDGVDAHTDHSALYAGLDGYPRVDTKDPRHFSYLFGMVTTVEGLSGTWAESDYHFKLLNLYDEIIGEDE